MSYLPTYDYHLPEVKFKRVSTLGYFQDVELFRFHDLHDLL